MHRAWRNVDCSVARDVHEAAAASVYNGCEVRVQFSEAPASAAAPQARRLLLGPAAVTRLEGQPRD